MAELKYSQQAATLNYEAKQPRRTFETQTESVLPVQEEPGNQQAGREVNPQTSEPAVLSRLIDRIKKL